MKAIKKVKSHKKKSLNNAGWLDALEHQGISIGRRVGHYAAMRAWAAKHYKNATLDMTDDAIISKLLADGFVPLKVNGDHNLEDDGVFLIKKDVLRKVPVFSR